ncbi:MAG: hypothetical protein KDB37_00130, partial [Ilumatobacter sp.]|nr:hypothetical protein [Ilumatobacter sp.]
MKKLIAAILTLCVAVPLAVTASVTFGAADDTGCWDEYDSTGRRLYGTVTPKDLALSDCTPAPNCKTRQSSNGRVVRLLVPHKSNPGTACAKIVATTTTTTPKTTTTTTTPSTPTAHFATLPPGSALPTDTQCAAQVRPMTENRPANA